MSIRNVTRGTVLADRETWAVSAGDRTRGLLDHERLDEGEGLIISPCNSVHMIGMRFALDVVFVDKEDRVVRTIENLKPMGLTRIYLSARRVIELPVGTIGSTRTEPGDQLDLGDAPEHPAGDRFTLWAIVVTALALAIFLMFFS